MTIMDTGLKIEPLTLDLAKAEVLGCLDNATQVIHDMPDVASFGLSNAAIAGDEVVRTVGEIDPDGGQVVILASEDGKCMFVGALIGVEHVPVGLLDRIGDHIWKSAGATQPKDWMLTIERKQCSTDIIEAVNGTVQLGNLLNPVPPGTWLKVTLQPG